MALRSRRIARFSLVVVLLAGLAGGAYALHHLANPGPGSEAEAPDPPDDLEVVQPLGGGAGSPPLNPDAQPEIPGTPEPDPVAPIDPVDLPRHVERPFGQAVSFRDAVEQAGLTREDSLELIAALDGVLDFRRCRPEDEMTIDRALDGTVSRFAYRASLTQRYEAVRGPDGRLTGRQVEVPIRKVRIKKGGIVTGSLGDALEGLSLKRSLTGVFVEVFEGQFAFATDTRSGDTFKVIVDEEYVEDTFLGYGTVYALEFHSQKKGNMRAFWYESPTLDGDFFDARGSAMHGGWLRTPVRYDHISSPFGSRMHPVLKRRLAHNGIDYAAASGTPVKAAAHGTVTFAAPKGANGNLIALKHNNGYETYYAHLLRFGPGIKKGVAVKQRQLIGYVGSTGRSTGPHLHFGLKRNGRMIDPASQLNGPGLPMPRRELPKYKKHVRDLSALLERIALETPTPVEESIEAVPAVDAVDGVDL